MIITVARYNDNGRNTIGKLFLNSAFECYTLEDTYRQQKVRGVTRIPSGIYRVTLRTAGGMHSRYSQRFDYHRGMLWIRNIPDYEWVYFHIGNYAKDTQGCPLVGRDWIINQYGERMITYSRVTYEAFYKKVVDTAQNGHVFAQFIDVDK